MKPNRMQAAGLGLALVAVLGGDALAQVQSKDQAKCLTSMAKTARKISGAVLKDSVNCIRKGAVGQLPPGETAEHCLIADLKGKVAKARASLDATELKSCSVAPDFAFPGATVTGDGYYDGNLNLLEDGFGADLDATLAASDGSDPDGRCSAVLPAAWRKLEDAMQKAVESCLKTGLKDGTIVAAAGFEACYQSILTDSRGKVAKAVAVVSTQLSSKCPAGSLAAMFPGLVPICSVYGAGTDAAGLAACSRERLECRTCLIFNSAYDLHRDCDQFDDALANGSCPACGNTVIDADEQCDDGNVVSGDGCTAACIDEFCGDGIVNDGGVETCDDGEANSDTTPGACRTNCQPAGCGDGVIDSGSGEQCDDGNTASGDGCTNACLDEFCGDGVVNDDGAETCDDGNTTSGDGCTAACADEFCGDGVVNDNGVEECDDSNATSGDGCTDTCLDEFCGDGVVNDNGTEQCDDGPANSDTTPGACRTNCRNPGCGDGIIDLGEQCDDGNNDTGDCCGATCQYDVLGTPCPGTSGTCVAPACDGAGDCLQLPANEGTPCEDDDICTASSTCQSGACAVDEYSGVGAACNYVVVGAPWNPSQPNKATLLKSLSGMQSVGGDWCGLRGDFATNSVFAGDIIATKDDLDGLAIRFAATVNVDNGDIITGGEMVDSTSAGIFVPGLAADEVLGGLVVPKSPSPTFYDTTGTDPRVAECEAAQNSIAATKAVLDALPPTADFGSAYQDIPGFTSATPIVASNVGGLNVFDMTHLSGASTNVTVTLDGGGSADTVMVLRISTRFNTGEAWTFTLTGGLTPDHLLIYVSKNAGGIEGCSVGIDNVGGGTLFCPDMQAKILSGTTWYGAMYGGDSGTDGEIRVEESTLVYTPFTAALP